MPIGIKTPSVELVHFTADALELLIYTKSTRLQGRQTLEDIKSWPMEKKLDHLAYMRDTIKSSWEFVEYTFEIHGVSREFTHQFVRTRDMAGIDDPAFGEPDANFAIASFAQESQRTVDASGNGFVFPNSFKEKRLLEERLEVVQGWYVDFIQNGELPQNARAILPTAVSTSIICKASLRTLHHMAEVRLCTRTQGQYQDVFRMMREKVYEVHPFFKGWIEVYCVNTGTCCFPRYDKCPIQGPLFNPETGWRFDMIPDSDGYHARPKDGVGIPVRPAKRSEILAKWESNRHEATPVAKDGKSM